MRNWWYKNTCRGQESWLSFWTELVEVCGLVVLFHLPFSSWSCNWTGTLFTNNKKTIAKVYNGTVGRTTASMRKKQVTTYYLPFMHKKLFLNNLFLHCLLILQPRITLSFLNMKMGGFGVSGTRIVFHVIWMFIFLLTWTWYICLKSHRSNEGASYFFSHPPDSKLNFESLNSNYFATKFLFGSKKKNL